MANDLGLGLKDLETRFEGILDQGRDKWYQAQIDAAARKLLAVCPLVKEKMDKGLLDRELIADKVMVAALRVIRNPEGYTNESEGGYSYGFSNNTGSGDLWYHDKELQDLGCGMSAAEMAIGSFRLRPTPGWAFPGGTGW